MPPKRRAKRVVAAGSKGISKTTQPEAPAQENVAPSQSTDIARAKMVALVTVRRNEGLLLAAWHVQQPWWYGTDTLGTLVLFYFN